MSDHFGLQKKSPDRTRDRGGAPVGIFEDTFLDKGTDHTGYDVSPDGYRLMFSRESATTPRKYLDVLQGWLPELQRRVPSR